MHCYATTRWFVSLLFQILLSCFVSIWDTMSWYRHVSVCCQSHRWNRICPFSLIDASDIFRRPSAALSSATDTIRWNVKKNSIAGTGGCFCRHSNDNGLVYVWMHFCNFPISSMCDRHRPMEQRQCFIQHLRFASCRVWPLNDCRYSIVYPQTIKVFD